MNRREVLVTLATLSTAGCTAPVADCPSLDLFGEEVCATGGPGVGLQVSPARVSPPSEVTFTVRNSTARDFEFAPDFYPFIYERRGTDWHKITGGRRLVTREHVTVAGSYAFTHRVPRGDDDLAPGEYLFVVPGRLETADGGEKQVNLVDFVTVTDS